jgi:hypothetical protein
MEPDVGRETDRGHEADGEEEPSDRVVGLSSGDERSDDGEGGNHREEEHVGSDALAAVRLPDQAADQEGEGDRRQRRHEHG